MDVRAVMALISSGGDGKVETKKNVTKDLALAILPVGSRGKRGNRNLGSPLASYRALVVTVPC